MHHKRVTAFTIIEVMTVIAVLAILVSGVIVGYSGWQRQVASRAVNSDLQHATSALHAYKNFRNNYPPNLAGTEFVSSRSVVLTLLTNAPSIGVYSGLEPSQNAQLFLNSCNANITSTPNNNACSFQGNGGGAKIHVTGTQSTNAIWSSPINESDITLSCGSDQATCDAILATIKSQFLAQGGTFPITVPDNNVPLPEPTLVPNGQADRYCLEGRAVGYSDIVYHTTNEDERAATGTCPNDPSLHYFQ